ncbi:MAG: tRNA 2-thiouridine(34) synthase MnmA [Symbiobacteriia bacterium]
MSKKRVVAAMSGGVDSSVTAALLQQQGYEVIGATMQTWPDLTRDEVEQVRHGGCCSVSAVSDARRVADRLGIPYYVLNFKENFREKVIDYFVREYTEGRTPNPCIACNRYVKFDELLRRAQALDADYVATGHYAKVEQDPVTGRYLLKKSVDLGKDQTYALYNLTQEQLSHTLMPLGYYQKPQVREMARRLGLATADKPDSQEICFVLDDDYARFVQEQAPAAVVPGPILDTRGHQLGTHKGLPFYTIGQRKGLGFTAGTPLYVVDILPEENAIVVGGNEDVLSSRLTAADLNWIAFEGPTDPFPAQAKIRYGARPGACFVTPRPDGQVEVEFERPQRAITPGQAVVFYQDDLVLGGGTIQRGR